MASDLDSLGTAPDPARILVCDDATTIRAMLAALLGRRYTLLLTASAEEALERAPEFAPDLVLTDHILPGMTGRELVTRLRANPVFVDMPIILLTAVGDADARADGFEAGADEYLVKPIRERELLARVASLLKLRRTLLALSRRSRELEQANAALRAAQLRLVRTERLAALGSLAAALAHDINNPLAAIRSGAASLRQLVDEAAARPAPSDAPFAQLMADVASVADEVALASRRLQEVGRDLRLFGSGDPGAASRLAAEDAVRAAISLARSRYPTPPQVELRVDGVPEVEAPGHLVSLVLLSLLDRAIASAGRDGHVRVTLRAAGAFAEIAVHDDGAPIPPEVLPRVFEPFVRLHPSHGSSGLGLSIAAGIVQGLGGHVGVEPGAGRGTCFRVTLPLAPPIGAASPREVGRARREYEDAGGA